MKKNIAIIENNIVSTNTMRQKLTLELMSRGYNVVVLTTGNNKDLQIAKDNGIKVIDIKSSNINPVHIFLYLKNIKKALKENNAEVCLTFTMRPAIWGNFITSKLEIPTITNITGVGPLFSSKNPAYIVARLMYKFVLKNTERIFFQNNDDMNLFLTNNFIAKEKAALIPGSGVDHQYFKPLIKSEKNSSFIFLFIGRLLKDKGVIEFVEAARAFKKMNLDAEFRIVGPLWNQNLKKNTITKDELNSWITEKIITYLGSADDVRPHIANADCLVLPSYREGTSNVLLEASSMERPSITCNTTGCREIIEDGITGLLCNVADTNHLIEKMKEMISFSPEKRMEMGKNARKKVVKEFDKQFVIDTYMDTIKSITSSKN